MKTRKSGAPLKLPEALGLRRADTVIIDADPNRSVASWGLRPGKPDLLSVVTEVTEATIIDEIGAARLRASFVLVDLEGTASLTIACAISRADLVIIPCQGSSLDAKEAAKAVKLISQQERAFNRKIAHAVLFTRTSAAINPKNLTAIRADFASPGVPVFSAQAHK